MNIKVTLLIIVSSILIFGQSGSYPGVIIKNIETKQSVRIKVTLQLNSSATVQLAIDNTDNNAHFAKESLAMMLYAKSNRQKMNVYYDPGTYWDCSGLIRVLDLTDDVY